VKKLTIAIALCCSLTCSPLHAKTFVGVLWPMGGPLPAIGLMELVAELKLMSDVEVGTYLHGSWPALVDDIDRQPPGTRTVVVGYSLGANSSVFVANKAKYVDLIIALQPSMLSWNPPVTGKVGRMIEIYNPNPWLTFGGMGSKKLVGENIEYITNYDSHPGAQFSLEFRSLVKSEIGKLNSDAQPEPARAAASQPNQPAPVAAGPKPIEKRPPNRQPDLAAKAPVQIARTEMANGTKRTKPEHVAEEAPPNRQPDLTAKAPVQIARTEMANGTKRTKPEHVAEEAPPNRQPDLTAKAPVQIARTEMPSGTKRTEPEHVAEEAPKPRQGKVTALLDRLTSSVNSGSLLVQRRLTLSDMKNYADRTYHGSQTADAITTASLGREVGPVLSQEEGSDLQKAE
jgi:hypothetical protein